MRNSVPNRAKMRFGDSKDNVDSIASIGSIAKEWREIAENR
jgi:hypothetical protein